jgi:hypothetical protein
MTRPALFFTSRTPTVEGQTHCRFSRYMGYHAGPHGTGYRRRALSVPLATGGAVHTGIELLTDWLIEYQGKHRGMPPKEAPTEVLAWAASDAAARYEVGARARGFLEKGLEAVGDVWEAENDPGNIPAPPPTPALPAPVERLILEQRTLIEGLVWIFGLVVLPQLLSQYRILSSEFEETLVLDCTCELGDGVADWQIHAQRGCAGIVQQGRADLLLEGWHESVKGQIVYDEVKTKTSPNLPWEKAWEHSGQLRINMATASRRLGKPITAAYIPTLFKGRFGRDQYDPPECAKYQHSALCYGFYDEGSAGFRAPDWKAEYKFTDQYGKGHTLPKTYHKAPIWESERPLMANVPRAGASRVEQWIKGYLPASFWPKACKVLGPFPYAAAAIPDTLRSVLAEEHLWRDDLDAIMEARRDGDDRPEVDIAADRISRSYQCTSFSGEPCQFRPVCEKAPGWEHPETMGIYEIRTPHHAPEKAAFEAAGVVFPKDELSEDEEEFEV